MNRRKFLQSSVSHATAATTALTLGSSLHAQQSKPPIQRRRPTYRVGIIGSTGKGDYGHGLDVVWQRVPRVQVVAVADEDPQGLAKAIGRTGAAKGYADYRRMLEEARPEIVAICPRWIDRHHEMAIACAAHGCHVYMEKPFCRTLKEADEIVAAMHERDLKLAIAHTNRYRPELDIARQLIAAGELGTLLEARARGKEDRRGGGEDLWVLGTHVLDLMRALLGDVASCHAKVTEAGHPLTRRDVHDGREGIGPLAGDAIDATYRFSGGATGYFASHRHQAGDPSRFACTVYGSQGVLEFPSGRPVHWLPDASWSPGRSGKEWIRITSGGVGKPPADTPPLEGNEAAVLDLLTAIEMDRQPKSSVEDARAVTEMIVGVFASQQAGREVSFPLAYRGNPLTRL